MADDQRPPRSIVGDRPLYAPKMQYLTDDEINEFLDDFESRSNRGYIKYSDIEQKLDDAHDELVQQPNAHYTVKRDYDTYARHAFLRSMMGSNQEEISREDFARLIRRWKIPSFQQAGGNRRGDKSYFDRRATWRKIRAYWSVHGPEIIFIALVVSLQVGFGVWQLLKYRTPHYTAAFGWGVTVAKACTGALYPTFFFLMLSISRYFSTLLRRSYYISRFFNWDLSKSFHIRIACVALVLTAIHALGHLTGTFVHGSDPANEQAVINVIGAHRIGSRRYIDYIRSVPGFTGIAALGLFCIISLLSIPPIRRWNYNVFQLGHLLVYPMLGLLMAHGTSALLQRPILGYFLAFPTLLVVFERLSRVVCGCYRIKATLDVLDNRTVEITAVLPKYRLWDYTAGQYILLQVPAISFFQWHPFTISSCRGKKMILHIKTDGDWTSKLRDLGTEIEVGINGPFGAPAQRFHDFNYSLIIGAGIGITPFSALLADLQHSSDLKYGGPSQGDVCHSDSDMTVVSELKRAGAQRDGGALPSPTRPDTGGNSGGSPGAHPGHPGGRTLATKRQPGTQGPDPCTKNYRRTDFHWVVRDGNYLLWLSDLLNRVSISQKWHREHDECTHLDIRINTHVTAQQSHIATHVYSWLLEMNRTEEYPASSLTGLLNPTSFGRPDFDKILDEHYEEMRQTVRRKRLAGGSPGVIRVGVFYCGAAAVGEILADKCSELTVRGREDGSKIEYYFMIEVFG